MTISLIGLRNILYKTFSGITSLFSTNQHKMKREIMQLGDLDRNLLQQIGSNIYDYVTAFIALYIEEGKPKSELIGSGTFIKSGNKYGILTAHHVVHSDLFKKSEEIGLVIKRGTQSFRIKKEYITIIDIGIPKNQEIGPDLSVVLLGGNDLSTIKASKSFWNIDKFQDRILSDSFRSDLGVYCLFGCPAEMVSEKTSPQGNNETKGIFGLAGFSVIDDEWNNNGFDYLKYGVSYDSDSDSPESFGGVSGAGLWYIILKRNKNSTIEFGRPILYGVAFYQTSKENNDRAIICHSKKSIYKRVIEKMSSTP